MKQLKNWWVFNICKLVWTLSNFDDGCQLFMKLTVEILKWNSCHKATKALFAIEYESNLHVKAYLRRKSHF